MALLRGWRDGTEVEAFVDRELDRLTRLAISLTGNRIDADDLVQETLAKVIVAWRKVEASAAPGAYARTIMVNTFVSGKRRMASREVVSDQAVEQGMGAVDSVQAYIVRHDLLSVIATLPRRQRAVVVLRYLEDLPVSEVASIMRLREGVVRSTCHRALTTLRAGAPPASPEESRAVELRASGAASGLS